MEAERDRSRDTERRTELGECLFCPCLWSPIQGFQRTTDSQASGIGLQHGQEGDQKWVGVTKQEMWEAAM